MRPYALVALLYAAGWLVIGGVPGRPGYIDPERAVALARGAAWFVPNLLGRLVPGVALAPEPGPPARPPRALSRAWRSP